MKVILTKDIASLGRERQIVEVKPGYANNYLIKNGLALPANDRNIERLNEEVARLAAASAVALEEARSLASSLDSKTVKIVQPAGPDGKLYGSVTPAHIAQAMADQLQVSVDRRKLSCDTIKSAGTYTVIFKPHPEVEASVYVVVTN